MKKSDIVYFTSPTILLLLWISFSLTASPDKWDTAIPFLFNSDNSVLDAFNTLIFGYGTFFQKFDLFRHIFYSVIKVFFGYTAALVIGIPLGIGMGWNEKIGRLFDPLVELVRPIPPIAWIPIAILWFKVTEPEFFPGIYYASFIIFLGAFFPILLNTVAGVKQVKRIFIDVAFTLGAKDRDVLRKVVISGAMPSILTGMRVGVGVALMCLVAAELVNPRYGIGYIVIIGMRLFDLGLIITGMILFGVLGIFIDKGFRVLRNRLIPWIGK